MKKYFLQLFWIFSMIYSTTTLLTPSQTKKQLNQDKLYFSLGYHEDKMVEKINIWSKKTEINRLKQRISQFSVTQFSQRVEKMVREREFEEGKKDEMVENERIYWDFDKQQKFQKVNNQRKKQEWNKTDKLAERNNGKNVENRQEKSELFGQEQKRSRVLQSSTTQWIKNGDFSLNRCKSKWCLYTVQNFKWTDISSWIPDSGIEIGYADFYIEGSGKYRVSELAVYSGTCIKQLLYFVPRGIYKLKYSFGCSKDLDISMAQIYFYFNDTLVDQRKANDKLWHYVETNVTVTKDKSNFYFKICGNPDVDWHGVVVSNISMKFLAKLPANWTDPTIATNATNTTARNNTNTTVNSNKTTTTNTTSTNSTTGTNNSASATSTNKTTSNTTNTTSNTTNKNNTTSSTTSTNNTAIETSNTNISTISDTTPTTESGTISLNNTNNIIINNDIDTQINTSPINNNTGQNYDSSVIPIPSNQTSNNNQYDFLGNLDSDNPYVAFYQADPEKVLKNPLIMKMLFQFLKDPIVSQIVNSPILRRTFTTWFSCFINIDHLWLYIYHTSPKPLKIDIVLKQINNFQDMKSNFLTNNLQQENFLFQDIQNQLNIKIPQTPQKFYLVEGSTRFFPQFSYKFFLTNIPITILVFLIAKFVHFYLNKFRIPSFLQPFKNNGFLVILLLDGNSEPFTYFLISDTLQLFSETHFMKFLNLFSLNIFFIMIFALIAFPFISRYLYERKSHVEIYDKCKNSLRGSVFFMVDFGLFNMLLGSVHVFAQKMYETQLILLFCVECAYIFYTLTNFGKKRDILTDKLSVWVILFGSLSRLVLIWSLIYFISAPVGFLDQLSLIQQNSVLICMVLTILSLGFFVVYSLATLVIKAYQFFSKFLTNKEPSLSSQKGSLKLKELIHKTQANNLTNLTIRKFNEDQTWANSASHSHLKTCLNMKKAESKSKISCPKTLKIIGESSECQKPKNKKECSIFPMYQTLTKGQTLRKGQLSRNLTIKRAHQVMPISSKILHTNLKIKSQKYTEVETFLP